MVDWDRWFLVAGTRKVSKYNTISYKRETIQVPPGYMGCKVEVLDSGDRFEVYHSDTCLATHVVDLDYIKIRNKEFERKVNQNGLIKYKNEHYNVGSLLAGEKVILRVVDNGRKIEVYHDGVLVKEFKNKNFDASSSNDQENHE